MLLIVCEMSNLYIKIYGFMIGGLISEAEPIRSLFMTNELELVTDLIVNIMNLIAFRSFNLTISGDLHISLKWKFEKMQAQSQQAYIKKNATLMLAEIHKYESLGRKYSR